MNNLQFLSVKSLIDKFNIQQKQELIQSLELSIKKQKSYDVIKFLFSEFNDDKDYEIYIPILENIYDIDARQKTDIEYKRGGKIRTVTHHITIKLNYYNKRYIIDMELDDKTTIIYNENMEKIIYNDGYINNYTDDNMDILIEFADVLLYNESSNMIVYCDTIYDYYNNTESSLL